MRGKGSAGRASAGLLPLCVCVSLALACTTPADSTHDAAEAAQLESDLLALPGAVDPKEAGRLARTAIRVAADLRARHRPLRPPHLGNLAYHLGLRERALCCHFVEDLLHALMALELRSVSLHWGVAHFGSALREHSAVVAVPTGAGFAQGLVLDAWRRSGRLLWTRVDGDRYPWRPHPSDDVREQLACGSEIPREP